MLEKQMKMENIYRAIRKSLPFTYIVYTTDNADNMIMRIYIRSTVPKKGIVNWEYITDLVTNDKTGILKIIIRGIEGITAAYVKEESRNMLHEDGAVKPEKINYIFTDGTNIKGVLMNAWIDKTNIKGDSVRENHEIYGLNAARNVIINELWDQIGTASMCHFTLYADEMCYNGNITSIDRYGSEKRDSGMMQRISDANPISVIENSAVNAMTDPLKGVSAPIMVGRNPHVGDLYNSFKLDETFIEENVKSLGSILDEL